MRTISETSGITLNATTFELWGRSRSAPAVMDCAEAWLRGAAPRPRSRAATECQSVLAQEWPRGATPRPRSGVAAERSHYMLEVRAVAERSYHMPEVR